jgi:tetratricopeptide (TPR) repeat protein
MTDDGYILGIRGEQSYFPLDDARIKSLQARGLLPSPLPPYELSSVDYVFGHVLWIVLIVVIGLIPFSVLAKKRRKRAALHLADGIAHHKAGDLDRAIESYTTALDIDPKFAAAFNLRGKAFAGLQDIQRSISDQTKAIRIEPKFVTALMDRGTLLYTSGNFESAISDFSRVIKLTKDTNAHFRRGQSYLGKNDFRRAIADFSEVIAGAPGFAEAYQQRSLAYARMGDAERAQADDAMARSIAS